MDVRLYNKYQLIKEGSTARLTVSLLGFDKDLEAPESLRYRIDDGGGTVIREWKTIANPSGVNEIVLSQSDTRSVDANVKKQLRRVTVEAGYGGDENLTDEYYFTVLNLGGIDTEET